MSGDHLIVARPSRTGLIVRIVRGTGWTLIATGVLILLYLVYLLFFTDLQTNAVQNDLLDSWELDYGPVSEAIPGTNDDAPVIGEATDDPVDAGSAYALMWFERDGQRILHDEPLAVVEGTTVDALRRGPGHYSETDAPGQVGNFAVAGHRTTYGRPFWDLQAITAGDEIHVVDRAGRSWVYVVREQRIVGPADVWVKGSDPLGRGGAWLTLTTCHPRFSSSQRLIVFAELQSEEEAAA